MFYFFIPVYSILWPDSFYLRMYFYCTTSLRILKIALSTGSLRVVVVEAASQRCFLPCLLFCSLHYPDSSLFGPLSVSNGLDLLSLNPLPLPSVPDCVVSLFLVYLSLSCTVQSFSLWNWEPSGHCTCFQPWLKFKTNEFLKDNSWKLEGNGNTSLLLPNEMN